jgi:hypothetical protein
VARGSADQAGTPYEHDAGGHALNGPTLRHMDGRIRSCDESEVKDRRGEGVAVSGEFQVFP